MINFFETFFQNLDAGRIEVAWEQLDKYQQDNDINDSTRPTLSILSLSFINDLRQLCILTSIDLGHDLSPIFERWDTVFCFTDFYRYSGLYLTMECADLIQANTKRFERHVRDDNKIYLCQSTPLTYAIIIDNVEYLKNLLHHGADIHQKGAIKRRGQFTATPISPLDLAILSKSEESARYLLENGAEMSESSFEIGLEKQQSEILSLFLIRGICPAESIDMAFDLDDAKFINLVVRSEVLNQEELQQLLISALDQRKLNILNLMLEHGSTSTLILFESAFKNNDIELLTILVNKLSFSNSQLMAYVKSAIHDNQNQKASVLLQHFLTQKSEIISSLQLEYLSMLNSVLNVILSIMPVLYYSLTKGYQQITQQDLRFFAFGEKQQIEKIYEGLLSNSY